MANRKKLGEILIEQGVATLEALKRGMVAQRQRGGRLGRVLVEMRAITEEQLARALAAQSRMPLARMKAEIPGSVTALLPGDLCQKHHAVAFGVRKVDAVETVYVAIADPYDVLGMDEIRFRLGRPVKFALAPSDEIGRAIARARGEVDLALPEMRGEPGPVLRSAASAGPHPAQALEGLLGGEEAPAIDTAADLDALLGLVPTPSPPTAASVLDDLFDGASHAPPDPGLPVEVSPPPSPSSGPDATIFDLSTQAEAVAAYSAGPRGDALDVPEAAPLELVTGAESAATIQPAILMGEALPDEGAVSPGELEDSYAPGEPDVSETVLPGIELTPEEMAAEGGGPPDLDGQALGLDLGAAEAGPANAARAAPEEADPFNEPTRQFDLSELSEQLRNPERRPGARRPPPPPPDAALELESAAADLPPLLAAPELPAPAADLSELGIELGADAGAAAEAHSEGTGLLPLAEAFAVDGLGADLARAVAPSGEALAPVRLGAEGVAPTAGPRERAFAAAEEREGEPGLAEGGSALPDLESLRAELSAYASAHDPSTALRAAADGGDATSGAAGEALPLLERPAPPVVAGENFDLPVAGGSGELDFSDVLRDGPPRAEGLAAGDGAPPGAFAAPLGPGEVEGAGVPPLEDLDRGPPGLAPEPPLGFGLSLPGEGEPEGGGAMPPREGAEQTSDALLGESWSGFDLPAQEPPPGAEAAAHLSAELNDSLRAGEELPPPPDLEPVRWRRDAEAETPGEPAPLLAAPAGEPVEISSDEIIDLDPEGAAGPGEAAALPERPPPADDAAGFFDEAALASFGTGLEPGSGFTPAPVQGPEPGAAGSLPVIPRSTGPQLVPALGAAAPPAGGILENLRRLAAGDALAAGMTPYAPEHLGQAIAKMLLLRGAISPSELIELLAVPPDKLSAVLVRTLMDRGMLGPGDLVSMLTIPQGRLNAAVLRCLLERSVVAPEEVVRAL